MIQASQIEQIASPIVEQHGAFLVDVDVRGDRNGLVVEIFADTDLGITADECSRISMDLSKVLDSANLLRHRYHLVVSSPGIDRPLKFPRQYPRNVGRKVRLKVRSETGTEKFEGELVASLENEIQIQSGQDSIRSIPYDEIEEALVVLPW